MLATREAGRLQIDAGLRSHRRRFGEPAGFWLPECAYRPGIESLLAEHGTALLLRRPERARGADGGAGAGATPAGPVAFTIDWGRACWLWWSSGYPSHTDYTEYHRTRSTAPALVDRRRAAGPGAAEARAAVHAGEFLALRRGASPNTAAARGRRGLVVFAIDTELLGHHWSEGPRWLEAVIAQAAERGIGLMTLAEARAAHEPEQRELCDSSWGEDKDLSTWDSSSVSDLAWGSRRLELRLLRKLASGALGGDAAERAARELLAVESSDWAFLDHRRQAGDYAYARAVTHAEALLEAIESPRRRLSHGCAIWPPT